MCVSFNLKYKYKSILKNYFYLNFRFYFGKQISIKVWRSLKITVQKKNVKKCTKLFK